MALATNVLLGLAFNLFLSATAYDWQLGKFLSFSEHRYADPIPANITVYTYTQKVDHFSYVNDDTFQQRVVTSSDHFGGPGSPIFFYTGNIAL